MFPFLPTQCLLRKQQENECKGLCLRSSPPPTLRGSRNMTTFPRCYQGYLGICGHSPRGSKDDSTANHKYQLGWYKCYGGRDLWGLQNADQVLHLKVTYSHHQLQMNNYRQNKSAMTHPSLIKWELVGSLPSFLLSSCTLSCHHTSEIPAVKKAPNEKK